ncbi:hypothetical protein [Aliivibrio logei]|uniref:Uncharacterized protein n=1 Tax=Aliivibrio logei TaxID=688 RepID=A0A1B9NV13_ALILO|nr:hypothetical protein [Aliivibrio logei]OCH17865.1 hypothetical protein A6E04_17835 [Aliivibrio logei]
MQNIVRETLQVGEITRTGAAKYLLMRDASNSISVQLDTLEPIEIKKNDVVLIEGCTTVIFKNHHSSATTIEYQLTDVAINAQSDEVSINGSVNVNEILTPVVISHVEKTVLVSLDDEPLNINNFPSEFSVNNLNELESVLNNQRVTVNVSNALMTQAITLENAVIKTLLNSRAGRKRALLQTDKDVYIGGDNVTNENGIYLPSGESMTIETEAAIYAYAVDGAIVRVLEEVQND